MKQLLISAEQEIVSLRRSNEILRAKVDTMDLFALVLKTTPNHPSYGAGEDVAWSLRSAINDIELKEKSNGSSK